MPQSADDIAHGAVFIGVIISIVLYGIMIVQTLMYFAAFKKDPTWRKCLVGLLFILETVNSVIDVTFIHESLILHFGSNRHLQDNHLLITCSVISTVVVAFSVQLFFAWRIQILTSSKLFTTIIVICALASFASGIVTAMFTTRLHGFFLFLSVTDYQNFRGAMLAWFISDSLTNVILTVTLVWYLISKKTGFRDTDNVIDKVIKITVPTGMITAIFAAIYIVLFFVDTNHKTALLFYFPLSKLYTNSMLSSLNFRGRWSHVNSESTQQSTTSQSLSKEGQSVYTQMENEFHQDPVDLMSKRAEVFVQVESHRVVEISGRSIPVLHDLYYTSTSKK